MYIAKINKLLCNFIINVVHKRKLYIYYICVCKTCLHASGTVNSRKITSWRQSTSYTCQEKCVNCYMKRRPFRIERVVCGACGPVNCRRKAHKNVADQADPELYGSVF